MHAQTAGRATSVSSTGTVQYFLDFITAPVSSLVWGKDEQSRTSCLLKPPEVVPLKV